jgi:DNA-binding transcriptional MerR regulator
MTKSQSAYRNFSRYSIKDLEHLSGIKAHTLRIWEQRYGILKPERTDTNIRFYSDDDLKYLLNLSLLNNNGFKISKLAVLTRDQIRQQVENLNKSDNDFESDISTLIISTIDLNEALFEQVFQQNVIKIGFEKTITDVIYPFLNRIGTLWISGSISPAQEHFISNLIRQKLIVAIDVQPKLPRADAKNVLIYTPENEMHELSILFAAYVFKRQQHKVYYLGLSVPFENVDMVVRHHQIDWIVLNITTNPSGSNFDVYMEKLNTCFGDKNIVLMGYQVNKRKEQIPSNMRVVESLEEMFQFFNK